jgi:hypothetical protein
LGLLCFALAHFTESNTGSFVGFGLMLVGVLVGWTVVGFYREDRARGSVAGSLPNRRAAPKGWPIPGPNDPKPADMTTRTPTSLNAGNPQGCCRFS